MGFTPVVNVKGISQGELGEMLVSLYEIKANDLEYLFESLRKK